MLSTVMCLFFGVRRCMFLFLFFLMLHVKGCMHTMRWGCYVVGRCCVLLMNRMVEVVRWVVVDRTVGRTMSIMVNRTVGRTMSIMVNRTVGRTVSIMVNRTVGRTVSIMVNRTVGRTMSIMVGTATMHVMQWRDNAIIVPF